MAEASEAGPRVAPADFSAFYLLPLPPLYPWTSGAREGWGKQCGLWAIQINPVTTWVTTSVRNHSASAPYLLTPSSAVGIWWGDEHNLCGERESPNFRGLYLSGTLPSSLLLPVPTVLVWTSTNYWHLWNRHTFMSNSLAGTWRNKKTLCRDSVTISGLRLCPSNFISGYFL